jgi:hypothetical protein
MPTNKSKSADFWLYNPMILFKKEYLADLYPNQSQSFVEKINAISRLIILLTILGFIVSRAIKILISGAVALGVLALFFISNERTKVNEKLKKEAFTSSDPAVYKETKQQFTVPNAENPMMNVLLTDYVDAPKRKPAAPSFNPAVEQEILEVAKDKAVNPRIFKDLGDNLAYETSLRNFHTNPSTTIPNDQKAFADFCYGDMPSCKEGHEMQCIKNNTQNRQVFY